VGLNSAGNRGQSQGSFSVAGVDAGAVQEVARAHGAAAVATRAVGWESRAVGTEDQVGLRGPFMPAAVAGAGWDFDTADVAAGDREDLVRDVISSGMLRVDLQSRREKDLGIDLRMHATNIGSLRLASMDLSPTTAVRGTRLARDDGPSTVNVQVKQSGLSTVTQAGRDAVFDPEHLVMVLSSQPSVVVSAHDTQRLMLQIPVEQLALPDRVVREAMAVPLSRQLPLAGVLGRYIEGIPLRADLSYDQGEFLARAGVELVRGLIATMAGEASPARQSREATMQLRVVDYLHRHWQDHDLDAARLAAVHHISTRQLYRLLADEGISLGDWLRQRRLDACREELARPGTTWVSVAAVGRRWGFPDATNFGRAFKSAFGVSPLQWRVLHIHLQAPG